MTPLDIQRLADRRAIDRDAQRASGGVLENFPWGIRPVLYEGSVMDTPVLAERRQLLDPVYGMMPVAGIFAGTGAKTANKLALQKAQEMTAKSANRDKVWKETGWFKDVDGQWKYEIDDSGAKIDQKLGGETVGANLKHDDLYRAYPGLKRAKMHHMGDPYDVGGGAWRDPGPTRYGELLLRPDKIASGTKSTTLHELQHAIQGREKFAKGGSPEAFTMSEKKQKEGMKHLEFAIGSRRWIEYKNRFGDKDGLGWVDFRKIYKSNMGKYPSKEVRDATSHIPPYAQDDLHKQLMDLELNISQALQDAQDPLRSYYRLAGEAEARNVQTRMGLTPVDRMAKPPWATLDVPEDELLVRGILSGR